MKIVKPKVELWEQGDQVSHIARCARVCYAAKTGRNDEALVRDLRFNKHFSMFRHYSRYFIIPLTTKVASILVNFYEKCPYVELEKDKYNLYVSTNSQFVVERHSLFIAAYDYEVTSEHFEQTEIGFRHMRYTFNVITQISTSRELNRVSPNNIAEQSTRYCNFSRGKFDGQCAICQPHWFDLGQEKVAYFKHDKYVQYYKIDDGEFHPYENTIVKFNKYQDNPRRNLMFQKYMIGTYNSCNDYLEQTSWGMLAQDARGQLPLDLATECVYTYSINEWRHIIDLRCYGTTGAPHPNAKIIASMIRDVLINEGHIFK